VNAILKRHGIPVPKSYYAEKESDLVLPEGPAIVKPCREDGSYGVSRGNVGAGRKELAAAFRDIQKIVPGPVVVEEYIEGREINAALLGGKSLPLSEIVFEYEDASHPRILTYEAKWDERSESYRRSSPRCPACLGAPLEQEIRETAERIFRILELRHYARVDFRVGPKGVFSVIDVNPNPSIAPDSGFLNAMRAMNPPRSALRGETGSRADGTVIAYKKIIDVFTMI
jgi:D-alanine-D-alanine ligase